jgi:hypothetical protein
MGEISLGRPRGRTDERRRRPALSHGPRKVAALTDDVDIMSININRHLMHGRVEGKQAISHRNDMPISRPVPSLCSSKSEFGVQWSGKYWVRVL